MSSTKLLNSLFFIDHLTFLHIIFTKIISNRVKTTDLGRFKLKIRFKKTFFYIMKTKIGN